MAARHFFFLMFKVAARQGTIYRYRVIDNVIQICIETVRLSNNAKLASIIDRYRISAHVSNK